MWFKNLYLFKLSEPFALTAPQLQQQLENIAFRPCAPHEEANIGWTSPMPGASNELTYAINGFMMICAKKEERVLPSQVVNEMLQEKIQEIELREARKLAKKERTALKDELIFDLLPKAFTFSRKYYAYIDTQNGWIVVDCSSAKVAEDLLSLLRKCLGSLPAVPINTVNKPTQVMTDWLNQQTLPDDIQLEDECELRSVEENAASVRCKRHELIVPEIKNHLDSGKVVIKLALNWADRLSFVLDEQLAVKRLRYLELIQEQSDDINAETEAEQFDADFAIMTAEFSVFIARLTELFGGLQAV